MQKINFGELRINDTSKRHVQDCLDSNWVTMGQKVEQFEREWGKLFGYSQVKLLNSGTSANTACCMALRTLGVKDDDEVICPALSFIASANAIRAAGLRPVFVDVRPEDLQIDIDLVEQSITRRTRAIMAVNLMGKPCKLEVLKDLCNKYHLILIVDNCEAYGAKRQGEYSLYYGDFETTSHYTAHICQAVENGTVCSKSKLMDTYISAIRNHGRLNSQYFQHDIWGMNFKPSDLHAAIGLGQIEEFWTNFGLRKVILMELNHFLEKYEDLIWTVKEDNGDINAPHACSITFKRIIGALDIMIAHLDKAKIEWKRNFGCMASQHKTFKYLGHNLESFPNSVLVGDFGLHIGVHRYITDSDITRIKETIDNAMQEIQQKCFH